MNLRSRKKIAARVLGVGVSKVRFDPEAAADIQDAITKQGLRNLVKLGAIWKVRSKGVSKGRRRLKAQRHHLRGTGSGSKKGRKTARTGKKTLWVIKVRGMRHRLKARRDRGEISGAVFKKLYANVKGGQVRNLKHLTELIKEAERRSPK